MSILKLQYRDIAQKIYLTFNTYSNILRWNYIVISLISYFICKYAQTGAEKFLIEILQKLLKLLVLYVIMN